MTSKKTEPETVQVEASVTLPLENAETGETIVLAPGQSAWVDPSNPGIAPYMDVYLHRVRAAD